MSTPLDRFRLDGQTIAVTGASSGFGHHFAGVLASALLLDYMLFERKQDMCGTTDDGTFFINMCDCYLGGCVCPCRIYFPKNQK